jgi:exo-beta-1,3-glucanase (GH17 family)
MTFPFSSGRSRFLARAWRGMAAGFAAALLASCGGGGSVPSHGVELRPLSPEFSTRKAVAYSPFRTAKDVDDRENEVITEAMLKQDMDLLVKGGFGLIRLFDSSDKVARQTLQVIRKYGMPIKMQLGIYVASGDEAVSQGEISRGVALANEYSDIVIAVSVGNETMVSWSFNPIPPAQMAAYLKQVRGQITQPVTTNDNWALWANAPRSILESVDFVALHTYPLLDTIFDPDLWDWQQRAQPESTRAAAMMDASIAEAKRQYAAARTRLDSAGFSSMPMVIGETGWKAVNPGGADDLSFRAHPVNQKMYYDRLVEWADKTKDPRGPTTIFYFEAFDEPWKQGDDRWGLWNVQRQARFVIQNLNPPSATWVWEPGNYTEADALFFVPPVVTPAITEDRFRLYSDAPAGSSEFVAVNQTWDAFGGNTASRRELTGDAAPGDGVKSLEIRPTPADYGWGYLLHSATGASNNLSNFSASGKLQFWIKTTYPGKLEIGIATDTDDRRGAEAYLQLENGDKYGYCNTNQWCQVTIPIADFAAINPRLDPSLSLLHFVVADIFGRTGNTQKTGLPVVNVDGIFWTR